MVKIGRNQSCHCGSGRKYKHCCWHHDRGAHARSKPAESSHQHRIFESDLDRLSNSVVYLVRKGRLDEADAACEQLRTRYPEVVDWLMCKAMVCEARGETEHAINYYERTVAWMEADPEGFGPENAESFRRDIERLRRVSGWDWLIKTIPRQTRAQSSYSESGISELRRIAAAVLAAVRIRSASGDRRTKSASCSGRSPKWRGPDNRRGGQVRPECQVGTRVAAKAVEVAEFWTGRTPATEAGMSALGALKGKQVWPTRRWSASQAP